MQESYTQLTPLIPALRRYARGMTRDRATSDDLVQDCLEKALANWQKLRNEDPRSWVFSILHNLSLNHIRRSKRDNLIERTDTPQARIQAVPPNQETELYGRQVLAAIANLPPLSRSVLLLVTVEERPYSEVSEILQVPVGTVMSRLSRARDQLRVLLDDAL